MRKTTWIAIVLTLAAIVAGVTLYSQNRGGAAPVAMPAGASFRVLLGVTDKESTKWDGSVGVAPGKITSIRGWRFADGDSTDNTSSWKASSRVSIGRKGRGRTHAGERRDRDRFGRRSQCAPRRKDRAGQFQLPRLRNSVGRRKEFLDGRAVVDRAPTVTQLTRSTDEQDFPAIAQSGDTVYVTYVEFTHSNRDLERRGTYDRSPKSFDFLSRPAGGDQVFLLQYSKSKRTWSPPMPVTAAKQDIMRATVAVDGQQRVWVLWSANNNGNFDIYAKIADRHNLVAARCG